MSNTAKPAPAQEPNESVAQLEAAIAQAIHTRERKRRRWPDLGEHQREWYRELARTAIEAHKAALAGAGYKILPRDPSETMLDACDDALHANDNASFEDERRPSFIAWRAMWDAAE